MKRMAFSLMLLGLMAGGLGLFLGQTSSPSQAALVLDCDGHVCDTVNFSPCMVTAPNFKCKVREEYYAIYTGTCRFKTSTTPSGGCCGPKIVQWGCHPLPEID